jgi:hypothetical protein
MLDALTGEGCGFEDDVERGLHWISSFKTSFLSFERPSLCVVYFGCMKLAWTKASRLMQPILWY